MKNALPFQFDVSIVVEGTSMERNVAVPVYDSDDSSDDDIDDDHHDLDTEMGHDYVGDIESRLKEHELPYRVLKDQKSDSKSNENVFDVLYDEFGGKLVIPRKRIISFVDCRKRKDEIYMFEPPKNCRDIPGDARDEWYLNSTRTCLLPGDDHYNAGKELRYRRGDVENPTIKSSLHADGRVLTFSFHVI